MNKNEIKDLFYCENRLFEQETQLKSEDNRSPFDMDHDRIIYSHYFRRMHDKTQVFPYAPLSNSSQARSRLSHSLEVSCVGRSLGNYAGQYLLSKGIYINPYDIGSIVASACLAHDIGNPPFGHSGEDAIRVWASKNLEGILTDEQEKNDILNFEGNAQGFRILTRLDNWQRKGGMRSTLATLAASSKYTCPSDKMDAGIISRKKFGYFKEDFESFSYVFNRLNLKSGGFFRRSPLAWLAEAADDICYAVIDVEDAYHLGLISFEQVCDLIQPISSLDARYDVHDEYDNEIKVSRMRSYAINQLISEAIEIFKDNFDSISEGSFNRSIISAIKSQKIYSDIVDFSYENIYSSEKVIEIECAGFRAIGGLLDFFVPSILSLNPNREEILNVKIIPDKHFYRTETCQTKTNAEKMIEKLSPYSRILSVTDFIAGMTDRYAIELFQRLSGIKLPVI
ncbi:MAG: dNTP triphosphohydrolase [Spirochaetes bacterium]|nr:dNTP triphosphohydrolase [Spirochaetota bacterium]